MEQMERANKLVDLAEKTDFGKLTDDEWSVLYEEIRQCIDDLRDLIHKKYHTIRTCEGYLDTARRKQDFPLISLLISQIKSIECEIYSIDNKAKKIFKIREAMEKI